MSYSFNLPFILKSQLGVSIDVFFFNISFPLGTVNLIGLCSSV